MEKTVTYEHTLTYKHTITLTAVCEACKQIGTGKGDSKLKARHDLKGKGWKIVRHRGGSQMAHCPECQAKDKQARDQRKRKLKALAEDKAAFLKKNRAERKKTLGLDVTPEAVDLA